MPESPDVNALKGVNLHDLLQGIQRKGTRLPEDLDPFLQSAAPAPEARRQHRRLESLRREAEEQARERRLAALFSGDAAADPSAEAAREMRGQARRLLETLSVPAPVSRHMAAERRAAEEGDKAPARGETQEAIKAKRRQILNHASVLEALEVAGATRNEPASRGKGRNREAARLTAFPASPDVNTPMASPCMACRTAAQAEAPAPFPCSSPSRPESGAAPPGYSSNTPHPRFHGAAASPAPPSFSKPCQSPPLMRS